MTRVARSTAGAPEAHRFFREGCYEAIPSRGQGERLRNDWRLGPRDGAKKLHDCLVPWDALPDGDDGVKKYDRQSVRQFSAILAKAGLEVRRK